MHIKIMFEFTHCQLNGCEPMSKTCCVACLCGGLLVTVLEEETQKKENNADICRTGCVSCCAISCPLFCCIWSLKQRNVLLDEEPFGILQCICAFLWPCGFQAYTYDRYKEKSTGGVGNGTSPVMVNYMYEKMGN